MSIRIYAVRFEWHIQMLNDFEIPWHEFFRRYWWGGTAAGIYELRRLQIKRCGRLGQRAVLALDCCPQNGVGHKKSCFRGQLAKKSRDGHKMGGFCGQLRCNLIQQRLLIKTESEGWGHGKEMVEDIGLDGLEFVPYFVFQKEIHLDRQS